MSDVGVDDRSGDRRIGVSVALFAGSNGRYYTGWQVRRRLRAGEWKRCLRQRGPDRRLVETDERALLLLVPIGPAELPSWAEIRVASRAVRVVDTRRPVPR